MNFKTLNFVMAINFIQRSDIKTMRKDILEVKKNEILAPKKPETIIPQNIIAPDKKITPAPVVVAPIFVPKITAPAPTITTPSPIIKQVLPPVSIPVPPKVEEKNILQEIVPPININQINNQATKVTFSSFPEKDVPSQNPNLMFAEKEFLKGVTEAVKEKITDSGKTEEKQRKKFMEEVEEWAKSNTK